MPRPPRPIPLGQSPTPRQIRALRQAAGLTQTQAAQLIWVTLRTIQRFEEGYTPMHPAFWLAAQQRWRPTIRRDGLMPQE